jgi:hypothetical protein
MSPGGVPVLPPELLELLLLPEEEDDDDEELEEDEEEEEEELELVAPEEEVLEELPEELAPELLLVLPELPVLELAVVLAPDEPFELAPTPEELLALVVPPELPAVDPELAAVDPELAAVDPELAAVEPLLPLPPAVPLEELVSPSNPLPVPGDEEHPAGSGRNAIPARVAKVIACIVWTAERSRCFIVERKVTTHVDPAHKK